MFDIPINIDQKPNPKPKPEPVKPKPVPNTQTTTPQFSLNETTSSVCPDLSKFTNINLKKKLKTDLFLMKTNLLLMTLYRAAL